MFQEHDNLLVGLNRPRTNQGDVSLTSDRYSVLLEPLSKEKSAVHCLEKSFVILAMISEKKFGQCLLGHPTVMENGQDLKVQ
jgi:hypothetical protein